MVGNSHDIITTKPKTTTNRAVVDNTTNVPRKSASRIPRLVPPNSMTAIPPYHRQHHDPHQSHHYHHYQPQQARTALPDHYSSTRDRQNDTSYHFPPQLERKYSIKNYVQHPMLCESLWRKQHNKNKLPQNEQQQQQHNQISYSSLANIVKDDTIASDERKNNEEEVNGHNNNNSIDFTSPHEHEKDVNKNNHESDSNKIFPDKDFKDPNLELQDKTEAAETNLVPSTVYESGLTSSEDLSPTSTIPQEKEDDTHLLYLKYNQTYCTNVIQCFFNAHLDDEWFRNRYSPFHRVSYTLKERERAIREATIIRDNVVQSSNSSNKEKFVQQCRLRIGKISNKGTSTSSTNMKKRRYSQSSQHRLQQEDDYALEDEDDEQQQHQQQQQLSEEQNHVEEEEEEHVLIAATETVKNTNQSLPKSHLLSSQDPAITLKVTHIPPHVSDAQLSHAFDEIYRQYHNTATMAAASADNGKAESFPYAVDRVCSTTVASQHQGNNRRYTLDRTAFVVFIHEQAKEYVLERLHKMNLQSIRSNTRSADADRRCDMFLEIEVDCSDPFNRIEIDYDGKGSAPPSTASERSKSSADEVSAPKIPIRKETVLVHVGTDSNHHHYHHRSSKTNIINPDIHQSKVHPILQRQQVTVLSAAVSSKDLIEKSKASALTIGHALDFVKGIPSGCRLEDLISVLFDGLDYESNSVLEDILDVSIAYLRRVHLFSFYSGQTAKCEGDLLAGTTGTIQLRLEDAEVYLTEKERTSSAVSDSDNSLESDMLVRRLFDIITKAVEESKGLLDTKGVVVSPEVDKAAEEAQSEELEAKNQWLEDHSFIDADGRARCSFHFCKKLFKDKTFLHKHLLKKHPEYLAGEQAKVHDKYMMQAWEQEDERPIPLILVDCGTTFRTVRVPIRGAQPIAEDPEPELFKKEMEVASKKVEVMEARIREEEEVRAEQLRAQEMYQQREKQRWHTKPENIQEKLAFVDVDDMEEEEVKLSLDQVEFPPLNKKKKKKKKLT
jgi:hypothetical protein